ncbi:MAG: AAA-like domain-containing protein [Bacteroidales bacterium]|nr:AAA-like domain-containing protein [Bacteroidales bacterium]
MKEFNTTGICYPYKHYMVNIDSRIEEIERAVAKGEYITINRGRQYGKTTTLYHLAEKLQENYVVFSISFESMGEAEFKDIESLSFAFADAFKSAIDYEETQVNDLVANVITETVVNADNYKIKPKLLADLIVKINKNSSKPIIVIIDEVDNASNYESFIELLRMLRSKYLKREQLPTFQSVILAGVYDIKNLKLKVRPDSDHQYNSPWNIAVAYTTDMSLPTDGIQQMLQEYESDHHTGMDTAQMAQMITDYTSGYPFFVSRVCQLIDKQNFSWNKDGIISAIKLILNERNNTFFSDLVKKLDDFPDIKRMLKDMLFYGKEFTFNPDNRILNIAAMFNYITNINGKVKISNRIIETRLYNLFMSEEELTNSLYGEGQTDRSQFIDGKTLKMDKILEKFAQHFRDIYGSKDLTFKEEEGRRFFMLYIRPIINGTGNYYIEAQTRDRSRTDMIIDYLGTQYIIEMKIWRGESYNERGENQLFDYLDFYHADKGYLLSFCFNKNSKPEARTISQDGREIVEVVV